MKVNKYNINVKGVEVALEKIVVFPVIEVMAGGARRVMFQASVYSQIYTDPMFTTEPVLTACGACEKAFRTTIIAKHGEPV